MFYVLSCIILLYIHGIRVDPTVLYVSVFLFYPSFVLSTSIFQKEFQQIKLARLNRKVYRTPAYFKVKIQRVRAFEICLMPN